jgi:putative endonuclease
VDLQGIPWLPKKKHGIRGIFVYTARREKSFDARTMPIFSRLMFQAVRWVARRGLREEDTFSSDDRKQEARRAGVRGETYAYWYLRRNGYVFVARNYTPRGIKGEIDLVGYDGKTLAFVEVRTRTVREDLSALPELSVTREKQHLVVRTAQRFLAERHVGECPCRFDVVAIDNRPGQAPAVRLRKDAFSPQM